VAGKHVYVEKPCSRNPWEGETMVQVARKHRRCMQMGTQHLSSPQSREAIAALKDGNIGRVCLPVAWYNNASRSTS
jgi:predicted dehydrogenase